MPWWKVVLAAAALIYGFLQPGGAVELPCTVTQDGPQTTYRISHNSTGLTSDPSSCDYSYTDASHNVLANENNSTDPVINHSINTLVSSRCISTVHLTATCSMDKTATEYTATCSTNCSVSAKPQVKGTDPWNALWVVIPVLVLVLAGLCCLCYIFRDGIRKICCCSQCGGYQMGVKKDTGAQVV